jgi:hypothetical protein
LIFFLRNTMQNLPFKGACYSRDPNCIVSRRINEICNFQTCARKIKFEAQLIDQSCWINFRGPELNQGSSLQNFSFVGLSSRSNSRVHEVSLEPQAKTTYTTLSIRLKFQTKTHIFPTILTMWYTLFLLCTPV